MSSPSVQMGYASGSANTIRPTSLVYPNGRTVSYDYGTLGRMDGATTKLRMPGHWEIDDGGLRVT